VAPVPSLVSATASYARNAQESTGTITGTFTFDLTASGGDVYVSSTGAFSFVNATSTGTSNVTTVTYDQPTNTTAVGSYYKIAKGQTARFVVNISTTGINSSSPLYGYYTYIRLNNIGWYRDSSGTAGTNINFLDTTVWKTNSVLVN